MYLAPGFADFARSTALASASNEDFRLCPLRWKSKWSKYAELYNKRGSKREGGCNRRCCQAVFNSQLFWELKSKNSLITSRTAPSYS